MKEGSVAQASSNKTRVCDRCFAPVPLTENFCPECGTALVDKADGSDAAVYPELARANLLRMRGDYKAAEDQCLSILRRYPNNETANVLLGDICFEKNELEQAIQWYEMALDLAPEDNVARNKLEQARKRFKEMEAASTVEQLMLPTTKSRAGVYAVALIASILVIAVVAYFVGIDVAQRKAANTAGADIRPISIDDRGGALPIQAPGRDTSAASQAFGDDALLENIRTFGQDGSRIVAALRDPRTKQLTIVFTALDSDNPRLLGANIAADVFDRMNDAFVITVRGVSRGRLIYVADAIRSRYEETLSQDWTSANGNSEDAWASYFLQNEWPGAPAQPVQTPPVLPEPEPEPEPQNEVPPPEEVGSGEPPPVQPDPSNSEPLPPGEG